MAGVARLLCVFGIHAAAPGETWNQGYGFARCRRCGRDLVRSLLDDWREPPRGFRIVWHPPAPTLPAAAARAAAPRAMPDKAGSAADDWDFMTEPSPPRRTTSAHPASFDDFMSDEAPPDRSTLAESREAIRQRQ